MGLRLFIARRFLFSKKSHSVINIISIISVFSVAVITAALVIILSAINGFEDTVKNMYSQFDPQLKITAVKGKTFPPDETKIKAIKDLKEVAFVCKTVEEIGILKNNDQWVHATIKGVPDDFLEMTAMQKNIDGEPILSSDDSVYYLIPGSMVAQKLQAYDGNALLPDYIKLYTPVRNKKIKINSDALSENLIPVSGVFRISPELDDQYALVHINLLDQMMEYNGEISAIEIGLQPDASEVAVKEEIKKIMGSGFDVKTRYEQKEIIFKTNQMEKLFVFMIMVFVLILAGFNVIAAVTMLVIDKQKDSETLQILGMTERNTRKIFFTNGLLINLIGGSLGLGLGIGLVLLQYYFHIVPMANAIIDYYPVKLVIWDVVKGFLALMVIAVFSSWFPVWLAAKRKV